jgi:hypothetical protein
MRVRLPSSAPSWASRRRHGNGNVNTQWRNPLCGGSTRLEDSALYYRDVIRAGGVDADPA